MKLKELLNQYKVFKIKHGKKYYVTSVEKNLFIRNLDIVQAKDASSFDKSKALNIIKRNKSFGDKYGIVDNSGKQTLIESIEPILFKMATSGNTYDSPFHDGFVYYFEYKDFKKDWCRLKFRVYNVNEETGGYLIDVILSGDMDIVLDEIDNIARYKKRKYGNLKVIQHKTNNNVPTKYQFSSMKKKLK